MKKNLVIDDGHLYAEQMPDALNPLYSVPLINLEGGTSEFVFDSTGDVCMDIVPLSEV